LALDSHGRLSNVSRRHRQRQLLQEFTVYDWASVHPRIKAFADGYVVAYNDTMLEHFQLMAPSHSEYRP